MNVLLEIFFTFFKIGLFTFGGGYAMIPFIENICVTKKKWITHEAMMNMTVIAESTPGPLAINCATFVGHERAGLKGAIVATVGICVPSFVIIYILSRFFDSFLEITVVANAFKGIKVAVGILIFNAGIRLMKHMPKGLSSFVVVCVSFIAMLLISIFSWKVSVIALMAMAAGVSLLVFVIKENLEGKVGKNS